MRLLICLSTQLRFMFSKSETIPRRPLTVSIMAVVFLVGWIATTSSWVPVITGITPPPLTWPQSYIALIYGFATSDLVWSQLFSFLTVLGSWKMKSWGWTAAIMVNAIWIYTMTYSIVRALLWTFSYEILLFTPFEVYAGIASIYLWRIRVLF